MSRLGLECAECDEIVTSIEAAREHEETYGDEDNPHGGWDTVDLDELAEEMAVHISPAIMPPIRGTNGV